MKQSRPAPFRCVSVAIFFFCSALAVAPTYAQDANTIRLQILNGKTGRPVANEHLILTRTNGRPLSAGETTDGEGYAPIPLTDAAITQLLVFVDLHRACTKALKQPFSIPAIRSTGFVSENTCSKRIRLFPQPGTLIVFVRDETFLEKMRH